MNSKSIMLFEIKHLPVNWTDGMKISKLQFLASDNASYDHIRDSIGINLTSYNFGLLPAVPGADSSLNIKVDIDQQRQIKVHLLTCRAVTQAGVRIELTGQNEEYLKVSMNNLQADYALDQKEEDQLDLVLTVDPYLRIPVGVPDPIESPPRHPHASASLKIEILPQGEINHKEYWAYHFLLAKLEIVGGEIKISNKYIPACSSVRSHPALLETYFNFGNLLDGLGANAVKIVQKIKSRAIEEVLSNNVLEVAKRVVFFLAENMTNYRLIHSERPPVFMISYFIQMAHIIKTSIYCMPINEKEELANYFSDWTTLSPGAFEKILEDTIAIEYDHLQIHNAISTIVVFAETITNLFTKLSGLDYIGKSKKQVAQNANLLVEEETVKPKKKGWGF